MLETDIENAICQRGSNVRPNTENTATEVSLQSQQRPHSALAARHLENEPMSPVLP
jgi:hypothetical protein